MLLLKLKSTFEIATKNNLLSKSDGYKFYMTTFYNYKNKILSLALSQLNISADLSHAT